MAMLTKRFIIRYVPVMGKSGFVKSVDWNNKKFTFDEDSDKPRLFSSLERDRFYQMFPHLGFVSFDTGVAC